MRQRLALATALLGDPAVLVLDEPANGLDPEGIQWLRGFLRHLAHEQGRTILVSSHLLSEVEQTVDRVVIVGAGQLVREGSMEQLRSGADGAGTVLVRGPEMGRLAEVLTAGGSTVAHADGGLDRHRHHARRGRPPRLRGRGRAARAPVADQRARGDLLPAHRPARSSSPLRPPAPTRRPGGLPMIRLVRAEWTKLFTTKVWIGLLLGACLMVAGFASLLTGFAGNAESGIPAVGTPQFEQLALAQATCANVLFLILGIIGMTQEYRHRTATPTFLDRAAAGPRRGGQADRLRARRRAVRAGRAGRERPRRRRLRRCPGRGAVADRRQRRGARDLGPGTGHLRADRRRDRGAGAQPGRRHRRRAGVPVRHRAGDPARSRRRRAPTSGCPVALWRP